MPPVPPSRDLASADISSATSADTSPDIIVDASADIRVDSDSHAPLSSRAHAHAQLQRTITQLAGPAAQPRADQIDAVHAVLQPASRVLVVQATGWGKSAVYWAATLALRQAGKGPTLVVSPLLALMRDQVAAAQRAGLVAASVNSTNLDDWEPIFELLRQDGLDVLLISPERLGNPRFAAQLSSLLARVGLIVIDEAHCISDWGFDFRPDYQRLAGALLNSPHASVLATTATANQRVTLDIGRQLGDRTVTFRGTLARTALTLSVVPNLSPLARFAWIAQALEQLPGCGIVYVLTVAHADRLAGFLRSAGHSVETYTGQMETAQRLRVEELLRHNQIKAVVATSALGMGYDKPDLGFCIHVGSPSSPVAYYQQVGRAGRALTHAQGVLLPSESDERIWNYFATASIPDPQAADLTLRCLAQNPRSLVQLEAQTGLRRGRLEALLKILAVQGCVEKQGAAWSATAQPYQHDFVKWEALAQARQQEADTMRHYAQGQGCLMAYLQTALDDPNPVPCGRCSVCTQHLPYPGTTPAPALIESASLFLRAIDTPIEPRKQWPAGGQRKGNLGISLEGRAVAFADDPAWSGPLQDLAHAQMQSGPVPQALLDAAVATLSRWSKVWAQRPGCVIPVPASDMALNRQLAAHIARIGRLPLHEPLTWNGPHFPWTSPRPPT